MERGDAATTTQEVGLRSTVSFAALAGLLCAVVAALAEEDAKSVQMISGRVQAIDPVGRAILLEDGTAFTIEDGIPIELLEAGAEVRVSYEVRDGRSIATEIRRSSE